MSRRDAKRGEKGYIIDRRRAEFQFLRPSLDTRGILNHGAPKYARSLFRSCPWKRAKGNIQKKGARWRGKTGEQGRRKEIHLYREFLIKMSSALSGSEHSNVFPECAASQFPPSELPTRPSHGFDYPGNTDCHYIPIVDYNARFGALKRFPGFRCRTKRQKGTPIRSLVRRDIDRERIFIAISQRYSSSGA